MSKKKDANDAMRRSKLREQRFRQLMMRLPEPVLVLAHGRIRFANLAAARLLGAPSAHELHNRVYQDLVLSTHVMPGGSEHHKLRRLDWDCVDAEVIMQGPVHARRVVLRDLSKFVATENALRRSEERFRLISEDLIDRAIITLDGLGYVVHWSEAATRLTGFSEQEMVGRRFAHLFVDNQITAEKLDALLRSTADSARSDLEAWLRRADDSQYYAQISLSVLFDREHKINGYAAMLRDLSAAWAAGEIGTQEHVRQSQRMESVGRLASGIAHDFNNLLTAIHGHAQFLIEDLPEKDALREDAEEIMRSAERAAALTRQLLSFSRGNNQPASSIDLNETVVAIERLLSRVIGENITLVKVLEPALDSVHTEPSQIEQILVNLVVNARDAMPNGGTVTIKTANTELAASYAQKREEVEPGRYIMLAVSDTGSGMDAETQQHIFEPFFTTKPNGYGTGLGLSTVYNIVKQVGGHVYVYSEPGLGTTFKIYFPTDAVHVNGAADRAQQQAHSGEVLLLVEDDAAVRALAQRVLTGRGYDVVVAENGNAALAIASKSKRPISLIISDVVLPDTNGTDLVKALREQQPECRVLLMSGYTSEDLQRQKVFNGDVAFIEKPFTPDDFAAKVRSVLDLED